MNKEIKGDQRWKNIKKLCKDLNFQEAQRLITEIEKEHGKNRKTNLYGGGIWKPIS